MANTRKRMLSLVLSLVMALSLLPATALAAGVSVQFMIRGEGNVRLEKVKGVFTPTEGGSVEMTFGTGNSGTVVIGKVTVEPGITYQYVITASDAQGNSYRYEGEESFAQGSFKQPILPLVSSGEPEPETVQLTVAAYLEAGTTGYTPAAGVSIAVSPITGGEVGEAVEATVTASDYSGTVAIPKADAYQVTASAEYGGVMYVYLGTPEFSGNTATITLTTSARDSYVRVSVAGDDAVTGVKAVLTDRDGKLHEALSENGLIHFTGVTPNLMYPVILSYTAPDGKKYAAAFDGQEGRNEALVYAAADAAASPLGLSEVTDEPEESIGPQVSAVHYVLQDQSGEVLRQWDELPVQVAVMNQENRFGVELNNMGFVELLFEECFVTGGSGLPNLKKDAGTTVRFDGSWPNEETFAEITLVYREKKDSKEYTVTVEHVYHVSSGASDEGVINPDPDGVVACYTETASAVYGQELSIDTYHDIPAGAIFTSSELEAAYSQRQFNPYMTVTSGFSSYLPPTGDTEEVYNGSVWEASQTQPTTWSWYHFIGLNQNMAVVPTSAYEGILVHSDLKVTFYYNIQEQSLTVVDYLQQSNGTYQAVPRHERTEDAFADYQDYRQGIYDVTAPDHSFVLESLWALDPTMGRSNYVLDRSASGVYWKVDGAWEKADAAIFQIAADGSVTGQFLPLEIEVRLYYVYVPSYIPPVNPVDPGTDIDDEDVPLADLPGLNTVDHYAYIAGYPDGTVQPNGNITRAEVATIFFRLFTDEYRQTYWATSNPFSDVAAGDWFNNGVSTTANAGIIKGYPDGTFLPNNNITRGEFATIAARFLSETYAGPDLFTDISGHWAAEYINRAASMGWINGYPDGSFRPDAYITRAEAMTLVNNMLGRAPHKDHLLPDMKVWPDNLETAWYYEAVQEATNSHDYDWAGDKETAVYEIWTEILPERDWAALEKEWSNAYSSTGGDVIDNMNTGR